MGVNTAAVQRLYIAYFNRPADPVGLAYWESLLPADTPATQDQLEALAAQGFSPSAEYAALYAGQTNEQIVNSLYLNLFGRAAEPAGLVYWSLALTNGTETFASIALQLTFSAQGTDATAVANKLTAATAFTDGLDTTDEIVGYSGTAAAAAARAWLATVDDDPASLTAAAGTMDAAIIAATTAGVAGVTLTLTDTSDTVAITTTNTVDTVKGMIYDDGITDRDTFSAGDSIVGNGKTVVQVTVVDNNGIEYVEMSGVNVLNIVAAGETNVAFDASTYGSDISEINLSGADNLYVAVSNLAMDSDMSISIAAGTSGTLCVTGMQDGWNVTACATQSCVNGGAVSASWSMIGDINIDLSAADSGSVCLYACLTACETGTTDATIGDIAWLDVNVGGTGDGVACASFSVCAANYTSGNASIGNVTIGSMSLSAGDGGWSDFDLDEWAYACVGDATIGDLTIVDISFNGTGSVSISRSACVSGTTGNATVGDFTVGNISVDTVVTDDWVGVCLMQNACIGGTASGDATAGNLAVGDVSIDLADSATFTLVMCNTANQAGGTGDATVGDITVGNVDLMLADSDACVCIDLNMQARVDDEGNATVGNMAIGDIDATIGLDGTLCIDMCACACVSSSGSGDATVGNITVGNLTADLAGSSACFALTMCAIANNVGSGDATVGDIAVGDVNLTMGDNDGVCGSGCVDFSLCACAAADSGDAVAGAMSVGDIVAVIGEDSCFCLSMENYACASLSDGNATVGDVTVGNISLTVESGACFVGCISATANAGTSGNGIVGDLTVGDITANMALSAALSMCVCANAYGSGTMTAIGDVMIGDVTVGGSLALSACVTMQGSLWSTGDIASYTVGDVNVTLLAGGEFYFDHFVCASGDIGQVTIGDYAVDVGECATMELDVDGANLAGVTVGNIALEASNVTFYSMNICADGDIGDVSVGNVSLNGDFACFGGIYVCATGDVGDVKVGNIDLVAATTLTACSVSVYASGDIASVKVGNITLDSSDGTTMNFYATAAGTVGDVTLGDVTMSATSAVDCFSMCACGVGGLGDVMVGDVTVSASGDGAAATGTFYFTLDANAAAIGAVTFGDIDLSAMSEGDAGRAYAAATGYMGWNATAVGAVVFGDISIAATAVNLVATDDATDDYAQGYFDVCADNGNTVASMTVGDISITLTNGVDATAGISAFNQAYGTVDIDVNNADIVVGDINLTMVDGGTKKAQAGANLYNFNVTLDAGTGDITLGDITVVGSAKGVAGAALDNLASFGWLTLTTTGDITVGDIDYSGYALAGDIDVSGYLGAANIKAAAGGGDITVNDTQNMITLGAGNDVVIYVADELAGTTQADVDSIIGFATTKDDLDFSAFGLGDAAVGGTAANYATFLTSAATAMGFNNSIDVFAMRVGGDTYVAVNSDNSANGDIEFVVKLTGVTTVVAGDFVV